MSTCLLGGHYPHGSGRGAQDAFTGRIPLRGVAVGRKNYLHLGSDSGGERAAVIYSILGTAKLNGLDPYAYLRQVIERIADHPINRIGELLSWAIGRQDVTPTEQPQPQPLAA